MAVISVQRRAATGTNHTAEGLDTEHVYFVETDNRYDTEIDVLKHPDVPKRGDPMPGNSSSTIETVNATRDVESPTHWVLTVSYTPRTVQKQNSGSGAEGGEPAPNQMARLEYDWWTLERAVTEGALVAEPGQVEHPEDVGKIVKSNIPISNSLGHPASDVPTDMLYIPIFEYTRAEVEYSHLEMQQYINKLNASPMEWEIGTIPAGSLWLMSIKPGPQQYQQEFDLTYREVTYRMAIWEDFDHPVYNLSSRGRRGSGQPVRAFSNNDELGMTAYFDLTSGNPFNHVNNGVLITNPNIPTPKLRWRIKRRIDMDPLNLNILRAML